MNLEAFKRISKQVAEFEKTGIEFDINIQGDRSWEKGCAYAWFEPTHFKITKLAQVAQLQSVLGKHVKIDPAGTNYGQYGQTSSVTITDVKLNSCIKPLTTITSEREFFTLKKEYPSLKFYDHSIRATTMHIPTLISDVPVEKTEDGITYRYIGTPTLCEMCLPHTHAMYVYLDKGFSYLKISRGTEKDKYIITNELTPDTFLVMQLCALNPGFVKQLENECFINSNKAKLYRIKFEKDNAIKADYARIKDAYLTQYEKAVNSNMIAKVLKKELPIAVFNRIKLTLDTADYEGITLRAPGMLAFVYEVMIFDDRTDIYTIIQNYIDGMLAALEAASFPELAEGETEASIVKTFTINGIEISVKRTTANTRRSVNGYTINKEELSEVCYRASCFDDQDTFDKFVKSVHSMSLKWHDILGNGMAVKIHDGLTEAEYKSAAPSSTCPRIKFSKEKDNIYIITGKEATDRAPIKLNMAIRKIAQLNRRTNNKYSASYGYTPRNAAWCRRELVRVLKACCTFDKKELVVDTEGNPVLTAEGNKQYNITKECMLTDEKAAFVGKMAQEYYENAIKKSSVFLAEAVAKTGAKLINFNGEECWYVEGQLHKYAVSKKTNQVYNYERGNYICIVEPGHRVEVGFDATACRLLALKNDSVRVKQIQTLGHG